MRIDSLPNAQDHKDLHAPKALKAAKKALKGRIGVYCVKCLVTGEMCLFRLATANQID